MFITFALAFFLLVGIASAADAGNVSSIESSSDNLDLQSSDINLENKLSSDMESDGELSVGDEDKLSVDENSQAISKSNSSDLMLSKKQSSFKVVSPSTILRGQYFQVKLLDENGTGISGKKVSILFNGKQYDKVTNGNGIASLKLGCAKKYYDVQYTFKDSAYETNTGKTRILVLENDQSAIKGSNYVAYKGFTNAYAVTLSANGIKLANKKVRFNINGKNYYKNTNSKGVGKLSINLAKGDYVIRYYFNGEKNIKSASGKSKVSVVQGMPIKMNRINAVKFYNDVRTPFKVKVVDARGNPVKGKIAYVFKGKKYIRYLHDGVATINLKLRAGDYKISYVYYQNSIYNRAHGSNSFIVHIKNNCVNNGYWVFGYDMKNVNLNTLAKTSTKHIFLNYAAVSTHGKSAVESFIASAKSKGISVHIWMQIFYYGNWISPVNDDGSYKYSFFNSKINEAKTYAKLKGVAGIHLDYLRFPGTAYKHANGVAAINYFTKELCNAVHKLNSNLIVSAAIMPEPDSNKYYYGQDVPTISKYLDVIIPMIYKGNYESGTSWIKSTTSKFIKQSNGAEVWSGIQSYRSDEDVTPLSASELLNDYRSAANGGATGVISFRWGISKLINFDDI